jgi:hypothetical protein
MTVFTITPIYTSLQPLLPHILKTHFNISHRRGVDYRCSVRSLLVSLMLTVQAAYSRIRLLTPRGLDLERALPGGCMKRTGQFRHCMQFVNWLCCLC